MGGIISSSIVKSPPKKDKRKREAARIAMMRQVERFIVNVYATSPRIEAILLLLNFKRGRKAFRTFLNTEKAVEYINLQTDIHDMLETHHNNNNNYLQYKMFEKIVFTYIADGSESQIMINERIQTNALSILGHDQDDVDIILHIHELLITLEEEIVKLMARDHFYRFLQSKFYKQWRALESSHAVAHTVGKHILLLYLHIYTIRIHYTNTQ